MEVMNPMAKARGLALGVHRTVRAALSRGSSRAIGHAMPGYRWCSRRPDVS